MAICNGEMCHISDTCCRSPRYHQHDRYPRSIRSSIGVLTFHWRRLRCACCGKTIVPIRSLLGLSKCQSKSMELERTILDTVSEMSYRTTTQTLVGDVPVPKSTLHRWVATTDADRIEPVIDEPFDQLFVDGTGFKRRCDKQAGITNRGEVRMGYGTV